jgi:hypothetical protein
MPAGGRGRYVLVAVALVAAAPAVVVLAFGAVVSGAVVFLVGIMRPRTSERPPVTKARLVRLDTSAIARWEDEGGAAAA